MTNPGLRNLRALLPTLLLSAEKEKLTSSRACGWCGAPRHRFTGLVVRGEPSLAGNRRATVRVLRDAHAVVRKASPSTGPWLLRSSLSVSARTNISDFKMRRV